MPETDDSALGKDHNALYHILQASPIPTFVINRSHAVTHWNRALERLSGYRAQAIVGSDRHWVIFRSGKRQTLADAIVSGRKMGTVKNDYGGRLYASRISEGAWETEVFFPNMGENGKWLFMTAAPVKQADGRTIGAVQTLWDKTDERRDAMARKRRNRVLSALCSIADALCTGPDIKQRLDAAGSVLADRLAVDAFSIFIRDGQSPLRPIYVHGADNDAHSNRQESAMAAFAEQVAESGKIAFFDTAGDLDVSPWAGLRSLCGIPVRSDGFSCVVLFGHRSEATHHFRSETEVLALMGGRIAAAVENSLLHERLIDAERLAAVGQTVAGLAHYIKNILIGLKGGSYVVNVGLERADKEKFTQGWQAVQNNISRIADLVGDLLTLSKPKVPDGQPCFPNAIAGEVCDLVRQQAKRHHVAIETVFDPAIPEVFMAPESIHRCLLNLVVNAIEAFGDDRRTRRGRRVDVRTFLEKDHRIRFQVRDNGAGMDEETRKALFSPFFTTKGGQGTGLGLMVTRKLVTAQGGEITVDSFPGKGTTFCLLLPYRPMASHGPPASGNRDDPICRFS